MVIYNVLKNKQTNKRVYFNYRCKSALLLSPYFVEISFRINASLDSYEICFILYPVSYFPSTHQVFSLFFVLSRFLFQILSINKDILVFFFIYLLHFLTCFEWHSPVKKWKFVKFLVHGFNARWSVVLNLN